MSKERIKSIIESMLFVWGDPLNIEDIKKIIKEDKSKIEEAISSLISDYDKEDRGIILKKFGDNYQLKTKEDNYEYISLLYKPNTHRGLSDAAMETLSIVAYKQPITKIEVEQIRGIKSNYIINALKDKGLIEEVDRLDKPGNPILYGTTKDFLSYFGLRSIEELPKLPNEEKFND
ncbi:MAG: SMC-Scp complex subunit ScpB, partial [bacterium]